MKRIEITHLVFAAAAALIVTGATLQASEADDGIVSTFKNTYVFKTYLADDDVKAESVNGAVTLTGTVAEDFQKTMAAETARGIPGVTGVDNRISTKAEVATDNADTWIGRKVKLSLMLHRNVTATKTAVEVKDGVVTLKGEAANAAQKELTAEYAGDIAGVKSVKNDLTVASAPVQAERTEGEKLDDASIVAQVIMALSMQNSTSGLKTKVIARNGEVTLTGIARNAAEKSLVTKRVGDIHGVTSVKNDMTVAEALTK